MPEEGFRSYHRRTLRYLKMHVYVKTLLIYYKLVFCTSGCSPSPVVELTMMRWSSVSIFQHLPRLSNEYKSICNIMFISMKKLLYLDRHKILCFLIKIIFLQSKVTVAKKNLLEPLNTTAPIVY